MRTGGRPSAGAALVIGIGLLFIPVVEVGPGTARNLASAQTSTLDRPNVLIILTDDQRAGTLSVMPQTRRWFGEGGITYGRAFGPTPLCCPARASLLTGRYAHNHGVTDNTSAQNLNHEHTLQKYLQDGGYTTALLGKFLNGWPLADDPPHFDRWALFEGGYLDQIFNLDGESTRVTQYSTDFLADRAVSLIDGVFPSLDPLFLFVAPFAPHAAAIPATRHVDARVPRLRGNPATRPYDRSGKPAFVKRRHVDKNRLRHAYRSQMRSLMAVDDLVGRVFLELEEENELDNTLAFFLSDNGYLWGEHGLAFSTYGKRNPYTAGIRIPMLARWPLRLEAGRRDDRLTNLIDVPRTVLDATGIEPEVAMDGLSLLGDRRRRKMFIEYFRDAANGTDVPSWTSIRKRRYQYVEYYTHGKVTFREFYRLRQDPWQLVNVLRDGMSSNDPDVRTLHRRLRRARTCSGDACL